jgi:uncharacterized protein YndB with AHSA1/START domain
MTILAQTLPFKIPPVVKSITFPGPPEQAFARFTAGIGAWWPLATHSIGRKPGITVAFEPLAPGGRLTERWPTGESHIWGTITALDAPARIVFTWHVGRPEWQIDRPEAEVQLVEVTFTSSAAGQTSIQLTHTGWESLGDTAAAARDGYNEGWNHVLALYASETR